MITNVVADMQKATTSQVLVTAKRATTKVAAKFLDSFKNFWFSVADAALSEGAGASKKSASGAPTSARLDVELVKDLILRVTELVGVGQPDIRFASSLAAFEMSRAVLTKIVSLSNNLAIAERQFAAATGARQGSLKTQVESLKRVIAEMEELVTGPVYSVVFMHRYRDSNEFIRTLCMENLSTSIVLRPSLFLQDKYLKYFGWMLSDSSAEVRRAALVALNLPFDTLKQRIENGSDDGSIDLADMSNVCMKFLDRISGCSVDVNVDVQPHAMTLLLSLLREGFLDEVENEKFWDQANFCAINPIATEEMRATSLQFVIEQIEAFDDDEEELAAQGISSGDEERAIVAKVDALASWIASSITGPDTVVEKARVRLTDLVVESLRIIPEQAAIATNWSAILRAINEDAVATTKDNATADTKVDEVKQLVLMRFLLAAVKCEVGDIGDAEFLTGTISKKGKITKKGSGVAHENLSVEILKALPDLFVKFSGDSRMLTQLASLPRYLIHSVFSLPQRKKEFLSLLKQTGELYLKSTDEAVLMQCAMSLTHMTEGGHTRVTDAQNQVQKIIDSLNKKISDLVVLKLSTTKKKKKGEVDQDSEFALGLALTQLRILAKRGDVASMIGDDEIEDFIATLTECAESRIKGAKGSNQTLKESSVVVKEIMNINTVFLGWKVASLHDGEDEKMKEEEKEDTLALDGDDSDGEETDAGNVVVNIRDR
jgi:cohesin complex subunit SA-1/2